MLGKFATIREKVAYNAIVNDELLMLMKGEGEYFYEDKLCRGPYSSNEVLNLLYRIDEIQKDLHLQWKFEEELKDLLQGDMQDLYLSFAYYRTQILNQMKYKIEPCFILEDEFRNLFTKTLKKRVLENEKNLRAEECEHGENMWKIIKNMDKALHKYQPEIGGIFGFQSSNTLFK